MRELYGTRPLVLFWICREISIKIEVVKTSVFIGADEKT